MLEWQWWEEWGGWVIDIGEGMCYGERCELCKTVESQTCTSETNNTLYVKKRKKKKIAGREESRRENQRGRRTMKDYGL